MREEPGCAACATAPGTLFHRLGECSASRSEREGTRGCPPWLLRKAKVQLWDPLFTRGVPALPRVPPPPPDRVVYVYTEAGQREQALTVSGDVYTDGALSGRWRQIARGGWGVVVLCPDRDAVEWGMHGTCTEDYPSVVRAELRAVLQALRLALPPLCLHIDNAEVVEGLHRGREWCVAPSRDGADIWRDIWHYMDELGGGVTHKKVKAHTDAEDIELGIVTRRDRAGNEAADAEAKAGARLAERLSPTLAPRLELVKAIRWLHWVRRYVATWKADVDNDEREVGTARPRAEEAGTRGRQPVGLRHLIWERGLHWLCRRCGREARVEQRRRHLRSSRCLGSAAGRLLRRACDDPEAISWCCVHSKRDLLGRGWRARTLADAEEDDGAAEPCGPFAEGHGLGVEEELGHVWGREEEEEREEDGQEAAAGGEMEARSREEEERGGRQGEGGGGERGGGEGGSGACGSSDGSAGGSGGAHAAGAAPAAAGAAAATSAFTSSGTTAATTVPTVAGGALPAGPPVAGAATAAAAGTASTSVSPSAGTAGAALAAAAGSAAIAASVSVSAASAVITAPFTTSGAASVAPPAAAGASEAAAGTASTSSAAPARKPAAPGEPPTAAVALAAAAGAGVTWSTSPSASADLAGAEAQTAAAAAGSLQPPAGSGRSKRSSPTGPAAASSDGTGGGRKAQRRARAIWQYDPPWLYLPHLQDQGGGEGGRHDRFGRPRSASPEGGSSASNVGKKRRVSSATEVASTSSTGVLPGSPGGRAPASQRLGVSDRTEGAGLVQTDFDDAEGFTWEDEGLDPNLSPETEAFALPPSEGEEVGLGIAVGAVGMGSRPLDNATAALRRERSRSGGRSSASGSLGVQAADAAVAGHRRLDGGRGKGGGRRYTSTASDPIDTSDELGHSLFITGSVVWCGVCGRYAARRLGAALKRRCPGRADGAAATQLARLRAGRHPLTGDALLH